MSALPGVSETFDPDAWEVVPGFDFTDITYHRARLTGAVRIAFDRPEIRNAFRPHTVDELYRALDHARMSSDVGCVILTGNGPSPRDGGWAFCSGGDQRIRGRSGYQYATGDTADSVDPARSGRLHILECMERETSEQLGGAFDAREDLSEWAPRLEVLYIKPDRIRDIIGPGGDRSIRRLYDQRRPDPRRVAQIDDALDGRGDQDVALPLEHRQAVLDIFGIGIALHAAVARDP